MIILLPEERFVLYQRDHVFTKRTTHFVWSAKQKRSAISMNRRLILKGKYVLSPLQVTVSGLITALIIHRFGISFISGLYIIYLITLLLAACSDHFTNLIPTGYNFIILLIGIAYLLLYPEDALFHISLSVSLFICLFFLPAVGSGDIKLVSASTLFLGTSVFSPLH